MDPAAILLVDNDVHSRAAVAEKLRSLGHRVTEADTGSKAVRAIRDSLPDLVVIESLLPDVHGFEVLQDVKRSERLKALRVLMTSRSAGPDDVVTALENGADDFVPKPFALEELVARIGACLRRPPSAGPSHTLTAGDIVLDQASHRVTVAGVAVTLAPREYRLLAFLLANQDRVYSRAQLLIHVWDRDATVGPRTVDVHVRRLRKLLEPFDLSHYIQTVRGSGYRFSLQG